MKVHTKMPNSKGSRSVSLIILAAGRGTRMNSNLPKVLHRIGAVPLLHHAMATGAVLDPECTVVVTGHGHEAVANAATAYDNSVLTVRQEEQLGTAHAVLQAKGVMQGAGGDSIVLYGDTPFIRPETLSAMLDARSHNDVVVLGFNAIDPGRYGRLITTGDALDRIIEYKDASDDERTITLCNSGVICADKELLFRLCQEVSNDNTAREYYLTDIVALAREAGFSAGVVLCEEAETLGINTRSELAAAEALFQSRARAAALRDGVTLVSPDTVFFARDTKIGRDAVIGPNVVFGPGVTIEPEVEIKAFCHLENCYISRGADIGPFARIRPGVELAENVHIGNFVEIKNATLERGVKVGHLTYLGDAHVGEHTNIGAGTVTCNYDGVMKHRTVIGKRAFIGSDTMLVAPVNVGDGALTGSGSVITEDVPSGALAIGRARQLTKPGRASSLLQELKQLKAERTKRES